MESQNTGLYFETTTRFFLVITIEEAGGGGGASCVSSALKPVSASPVEDAGPNANLGVPGATCSEVELMSRRNPVPKLAPRFRRLIREARTGGQECRASRPHLH